jgi:hypothetical protein
MYTSFYINVTMTLGNESWRTGHRYSEFYQLYSETYNQSGKSFPSGMNNPFPTDRLSNWLSLKNQETINDDRRKALDSWLKELCNCATLMLHDETRKKVFLFLQVDENLAKLRGNTPIKVNNPPKPSRDELKRSHIIPPQPPLNESIRIGQKSPGKVEETDSYINEKRKAAATAAQKNDSRDCNNSSSISLPSPTEVFYSSIVNIYMFRNKRKEICPYVCI